MPERQKLFCMVNEGTQLSIYRADKPAPWYVVERDKCCGATPEEKTAAFNQVVIFQRTAFHALAEYKELHRPSLPGLEQQST